MKKAIDMAAANPSMLGHLNCKALPTQYNADGEFTGDILGVYDALKAKAKRPLKALINRGASIRVSGNTRATMPLFLVGDSEFAGIADAYEKEGNQIATNRHRITMREYTGGANGEPRYVYWIDNRVPVIPLSDINGFDPYIAAQTHFAGIVASGVLQIGASFRALPRQIESADIGFRVARNDDWSSDEYGIYTVGAHALEANTIADPSLAVMSINAAPVK